MTDLLAAARAEATRLQHDYVGTEHLFSALLRGEDRTLATILTAFSATPEAVQARLEQRLPKPRGVPVAPADLPVRSGARRALDAAQAGADREGVPLAPRHVLAALLGDSKGVVAASLADLGIPVDKVRQALGEAGTGIPAAQPEQPATPPPRQPGAERQERTRKGRNEPARSERQEAGASPARAARGERDRRRKEDKPERPPRGARAEPASEPQLPRRIAPVQQSWLTWRKLPLVAIPLSLVFAYGGTFPPLLVFLTACVAVLPLAGYMGEATEHLAAKSGPALGGLLNATFGNAAELIIAVVALRAGLVELVKASITGSILGNLLLILGLSLVAGGLNRPLVRFSRTSAGMSAGMLALAVTGLIFPAIFHHLHAGGDQAVELHLSEAVAVILALTYLLSLLFSLKTHRRLLSGEPHPLEGVPWSVAKAVVVLAAATAGVAVESEILVHAVQGLATGSRFFSEAFLGLIVIPIIGNAAEHATAVVVARKGKMDLAFQIALGSSTQVALLVAPLLVFVGALLGPTASGTWMNLAFSPLEVIAVALSTIMAAIITLDGESHWFEGVQLLALYAMVAVAVYFI
ncbi:MAG TPA: calcium/proton exchanger [Gemmatimonadales bacterium]|nr:calcium/proton exchanger [Gemmatimonadales bacterium]